MANEFFQANTLVSRSGYTFAAMDLIANLSSARLTIGRFSTRKKGEQHE
jgi:hypothetical protein